jgi:hypothetical protein
MRSVSTQRYRTPMTPLFPGPEPDPVPYRVTVTLGTPGDFDPAAFADDAQAVAKRLDMAGVTVAAMAGRLEVEVEVQAPDSGSAVVRAAGLVAPALGGYMRLLSARVAPQP